VGFVELKSAFAAHTWCSRGPMAYGLSIYTLKHASTLKSQAPFHPTIVGQQLIERLELPEARRLLGL
jgi:hypothetical protein